MKRRKKLLTRRRRALRCAAAALVLLLLAQSLLHTALLLPIQAVRRSEDRLGVQGTRVIRRQWKPDLHNGTALFYLTANDRAVLLSDTFFDAQGWLPKSASLLDCTGGKPLHAGERIILLDAGEDAENRYYGTHLFFYGRVDDPAIETLEIQLQAAPDDEAAGGGAGGGSISLTAPIFQKSGRRYFLLDYRMPFLVNFAREDRMVGRDAAGNTVTELQIELTGNSSSRRAPRGAEADGGT